MSSQPGERVQALTWREGCWETLTWKARSPFPTISLEVAELELAGLHGFTSSFWNRQMDHSLESNYSIFKELWQL